MCLRPRDWLARHNLKATFAITASFASLFPSVPVSLV